VSAEDELAPKNDRRIELRCEDGHLQTILTPAHSLLQAEQLGVLLDGTAPCYAGSSPLLLGKCALCGKQLVAEVKGY
jgi:hypothetical protein